MPITENSEYNLSNNKLNVIWQLIISVVLILFSILIIQISMNLTGNTLIYAAVASVFAILVILFFNPKVWLYSVFLFLGLFSSDTGAGISPTDVFFAVYLNGSLFFWFLYQILINRRKLIDTKVEWLLLFAFILILFTVLNPIFRDIDFLGWIREYAILSLTLFYFPLKAYINNNNELRILLIILIISSIFAAGIQLFRYQTAISDIQYAYQLGGTVRINQYLYIVGAVTSFLLFYYERSVLIKMLLYTAFVVNVLALVSTFSRIFWAAMILNFIVAFFLIDFNKKVKTIALLMISLITAYIIASIFFGDILSIFIEYVERRFESSAKGTQDISAQSRFAEWEVVISKIMESPFIGQGFDKSFTFKNPIVAYKDYSTVIHNSYLFFAYRFGIPLALIILFVFFHYFIRGIFQLFSKNINEFSKLLTIIAVTSFIALFITSFFTSTIAMRDGVLINAFILFLVYYVDKQNKIKKLE